MFALLVLLDVSLSIAQVIIFYFNVVKFSDTTGIRYYMMNQYDFALNVQYVHMFLYGLNMLECVMSISGLGFDQYFSRNVNKIEFACGVILGTIMVSPTAVI